jgi:hypothetical protein
MPLLSESYLGRLCARRSRSQAGLSLATVFKFLSAAAAPRFQVGLRRAHGMTAIHGPFTRPASRRAKPEIRVPAYESACQYQTQRVTTGPDCEHDRDTLKMYSPGPSNLPPPGAVGSLTPPGPASVQLERCDWHPGPIDSICGPVPTRMSVLGRYPTGDCACCARSRLMRARPATAGRPDTAGASVVVGGVGGGVEGGGGGVPVERAQARQVPGRAQQLRPPDHHLRAGGAAPHRRLPRRPG